MNITLSIVEDDSRLRSSLGRLLGQLEGCQVVSLHPNAEHALENLPGTIPRVVLMDINLPGIDGIECIRRLKPLMPGTEFVILTAYEDSERIFGALAAGASGYLLKQAEMGEIHEALRQVASGGAPMSGNIARMVVNSFRGPASPKPEGFEDLSTRELEVLESLSKGLLYKEIAESLGISYATVNNHVRNIYRKLHVNSRTEAVIAWFASRGRGDG